MRSYLAKHQPIEPRDTDELRAMRAAAWHTHGILTIRPEEIENEFERKFIEAIAEKVYGPRNSGLEV